MKARTPQNNRTADPVDHGQHGQHGRMPGVFRTTPCCKNPTVVNLCFTCLDRFVSDGFVSASGGALGNHLLCGVPFLDGPPVYAQPSVRLVPRPQLTFLVPDFRGVMVFAAPSAGRFLG